MLIIIVAVAVLLFLFYLWIKPYMSPIRHIPEPPAWPFLGHSPTIYFNDTISMHEKWGKEFKSHGMYKLRHVAIGLDLVFLTKPDWCKYVLSRPEDFVRSSFFEKYFPILGNGLLIAKGEHHRFQKKILRKAFTVSNIRRYVPVFDNHAGVLVNLWKELLKNKKDGTNIDIKEFTNNLSFDIISEVGFGFQGQSQINDTNPIVNVLKNQSDLLMDVKRRALDTLLPFLHNFLYLQNLQDGKAALNNILRNRKEKVINDTLTTFEKNDLLSIMMNGKDEESGKAFTDELIKDGSYTFLFAGHETTGAAIPIALLHLSQHIEMQERARKEIQSRLNGKTEPLTSEDIDALPYTTAFIKESLRFLVPLPMNGRVAQKDCTFGNYHIPKGTHLFFTAGTANRDPEKFDFPDEFIPDRYLEGSKIKTGPSLTFGYGSYNCIGKHFSIQEIQVTIIRLLQNFRFTIDSDKDKFTRKVLVTVKFKPAILLRVQEL